MNKEKYTIIENYMHTCMNDSAHDCDHIYRVLYYALDISLTCEDTDEEVLIASALLHDIGREAQFKDHTIDHAQEGASLAYDFLINNDWIEAKAKHVSECIGTHRFRSNHPPISIEAKILFDADKLDVTGAIGIARTIAYKETVSQPLYSVDENGQVLSGEGKEGPSFFKEYHYKLKNIYGRFFTDRAAELAKGREKTARDFYEGMYNEVNYAYSRGNQILKDIVD